MISDMTFRSFDPPHSLPPVADPKLIRLIAYWHTRRGSRFAPSRSDIDPLDMEFALGHLALIDVVSPPRRFRFRVHGQNLAVRSNAEMTNRYVDQFPEPEYRDFMLGVLNRVVDTRNPWGGVGSRLMEDRRQRFEWLILPLSEDQEAVTMTLGGMIYL